MRIRDYKKEDSQRGNSRERGYKSEWDNVREKKRKLTPYCEECKNQGIKTLAEIVHHKRKVKSRPDLLLNMNNLESLCRLCHAERHNKNMNRKKVWVKTDNSMENEKALMRSKYLPKNAKVLDCFCGNGEMYSRAYKNRIEYYHGVDKEKIHTEDMCELNNNINYVTHNNISQFNTFDLDDYGSPWKQLYLIAKKLLPGEYTFFITDGLVMHQKVDGQVTKFVSGTERIPQGMNLPGINRFYIDIFATMLKDLERRYNCKVRLAKYFHNERRSVYYWVVKLEKQNPGSTESTT